MAQSDRQGDGSNAQAAHAQSLIRARGPYEHIQVRADRGHLVVESLESDAPRPLARLTPLGAGLFGASFWRHDEKWERMPIFGPVEKVVDDLVETLAPYLQLIDFPDPNRGT